MKKLAPFLAVVVSSLLFAVPAYADVSCQIDEGGTPVTTTMADATTCHNNGGAVISGSNATNYTNGACFGPSDCTQYGAGYTCDTNTDTCVSSSGQQVQNTNPTCPSGQYYDSQRQTCSAFGAGGISNTGVGGGINQTYIQGYANSITGIINTLLVPILVAVAFIVFLWGVFKYFIYGAANEESRTEGAKFVMYGVIGFVIIFSVWGLVNLLMSTLSLTPGGHVPTTPTL